MVNKSGSFKKKKNYFSQVSNNVLRDKKLSLKAKGLYALIQSYTTIEDFVLYKSMLVKQSDGGQTVFNGAWNELKENGYLLQEKKNTGSGWLYEYELLDTPIDRLPTGGKPIHGEMGVYNNTDLSNTDLSNKKDIYINLPVDGDYINYYKSIFKEYLYKNHMRVTQDQLDYIIDSVNIIKSDVEYSDWQNAVIEHFENLPDSNNGNIIAFLKASARYFNIDLERC